MMASILRRGSMKKKIILLLFVIMIGGIAGLIFHLMTYDFPPPLQKVEIPLKNEQFIQ